MGGTGLQGRNRVLAAMIFAVAMTFIDQTSSGGDRSGMTFIAGPRPMTDGRA